MSAQTGELAVFKWWHRGRTPDGITLSLSGRVIAGNSTEASNKVDAQLRHEHPDVRWMQGREIESGKRGDWQYGPTVQKLRGATKQLAKLGVAA